MPFATALAVGSLALGGVGIGLNVSAQKKAAAAAKQQAAIAAQQAQLSAEFSNKEEDINQQVSALTYEGARKSTDISKAILGYQQDVGKQQNIAMHLDANRRELEIVRQQQRARSLALATATAQGSSRGSGLQGGYGQISGQTGVNFLGVEQNRQIGQNIFDINSLITGKNVEMQDLQQSLAFSQADLQTQKSKLIQEYAKRGADLQTLYSSYGGQIASAQGQAAIGSALLSGGQMLFQGGNLLYKGLQSPTTPLDISYGGPYSSAPPTPYQIPLPIGPGSFRGLY